MGAEVCVAAEAPLGKPVTLVSVEEGYRIWSAHYDRSPNPLTALETRILVGRLGLSAGCRFLDAGAGTGRWMKYAAAQGAHAAGIDLSSEMLAAAADPSLSGRLVRGDIRRLPLADRSFEFALCSLTLGYIESAEDAVAELARVSRRIIVSDIHPAALDAGWTRSFRIRDRVYEIQNFRHRLLCPAGLREEWSIDGYFGEPERHIFEIAGMTDAFEAATAVPAIRAVCWS